MTIWKAPIALHFAGFRKSFMVVCHHKVTTATNVIVIVRVVEWMLRAAYKKGWCFIAVVVVVDRLLVALRLQ